MRWYGKKGGDHLLKEFPLIGKEAFVADLVVDALEVFLAFEVTEGKGFARRTAKG